MEPAAPAVPAAALDLSTINIVGYRLVPPDQLLANPLNARRHPTVQREATRASLRTLGWIAPLLNNLTTGHLIDGHERAEEALTAGVPLVPVMDVTLTEEQERLALAVYDPITTQAVYDDEALQSLIASVQTEETALLSLMAGLTGLPSMDYDTPADLAPGGAGDPLTTPRASLADRFLVPPFSVLDARQGYWQARKRQWLALGIQSELGRGDNVLGHSDQSINIDFYAQKRALEAELGRETTTDEARTILAERGTIRLTDRSGDGNGLLGFSEQARTHYREATPGGPTGKNSVYTRKDRKPASADARAYGTGGPGTMDAQRKTWRTAPATPDAVLP
jgi:hypothetical protein